MLFTLIGRRTATALLMAAVLRPSPTPAAELIFKDAGPEGFQYADSKLGSGGTHGSNAKLLQPWVVPYCSTTLSSQRWRVLPHGVLPTTAGSPPVAGQRVAIDYVMSTTGARYGAKIDSTVDRQAPYAWTLGDGSTIKGLELAITGSEGATCYHV